ncbi:MAG: hypothetical protein CMF96_02210 [Candidatus Marinimicrobia bacterium]|nr:hypothetical protein [Candidatus Neomarinimicrobiota bacterium]
MKNISNLKKEKWKMKNVMILLLSILTTGLFAGGYSPEHGPGDQWLPTGSTQQAFIIFDEITLNGDAVDSGEQGGATGVCDSGECDILGAMYNGQCVGWSYMPSINGGVTLAIELNDGTTEATFGYPAINAAFAPEITFNFYDNSESKMYYNVAASGLQTGNALQYGAMYISGSTDLCSSNGALFGPVEEYCADGAGCELSNYADGSAAAEFDAVGTSDAACGGFSACGDESITALNSSMGAPYLNADNSLCEYGGCLDASASNFVANGTVDLGGCTYEAPDVDCSYAYEADGTTTLTFGAPSACGDGEFECGSGECIPASYFCDGSSEFGNAFWGPDCLDGSDEGLDTCCDEGLYDDLTCGGGPDTNCEDTDNGATDPYGDDCAAYNSFPSWCGNYDDDDFISNEMCCVCGGGSAADGSMIVIDDNPVADAIKTMNREERINYFNNYKNQSSSTRNSSFTCNGEACDGTYSLVNTTDASGSVFVTEDNGAVDAEGGSVTHTTECVYTMPLPEMTIDGFTAEEGCITTDFSGVFDFDGSDVDPVCGLMAGEEYEVTVTGYNASGDGTASGFGSTLPFACEADDSCVSMLDNTPSTFSINVEFAEGESYADAVWEYQACFEQVDGDEAGCTGLSSATSVNINGLSASTEYSVTIEGVSQYGTVTSTTEMIMTNEPPEGEVWALDISAKMAVLGTQLIEDPQNRIGFYHANPEDALTNDGAPMPVASDGFDAYWDVPEPMVPNPDNEIHFYIVNNWDEQTGWGHEWAYDIRAYRDEHYASNNTTTFNGVVVAEVGGLGTLTISPQGLYNLDTDLSPENYVPVYALVNGGGHDGDYYKIEGVTDIPLTLQSGVPVTVDFIVGNLVPEAADDLTSSTSASEDAEGSEWKPSSSISWATDSSCDVVVVEGINYNDQSQGPQFGSQGYELTKCNDFEQRYPATAYSTASSSERGESGMETGGRDVSTDGSEGDSESNLEFTTSYTYTVTAESRAGVGASTSTSLTTVGNVDPTFTDLCNNDGGYNNDCGSVISSDADGAGSGPETDEGLVTDESDDVHLYHTYTTAHDGIGRLSDGGTDADGLDQSGTPMTITLGSEYTDHEGYLLDASWSGDLELDNPNHADGNASSVSFTVTEPNSGNGSSYTFDLAVTDDDWLTNGSNGSNTINTSVTVTILPEPNQAPVAEVSVPEGQLDEVGGGYWQVPHNGDNDYNCDDLVPYEDQDCDDNRASVTLSHNGSYDPDCDSEDPLCEEHDRYWSEAVMGMTYNDLNMNGQYDEGEPCSDDCLWAFDENGIAPAIDPGPESHAVNHSQRTAGGSGNIWTLTVQDNYGAENTAARGFYVLPEPNTRAMNEGVYDATSEFEVESDNGLVHYIPSGSDAATVTISLGSVSDLDGDLMFYTTTMNGDVVDEATGSCAGGCVVGSGEFLGQFGVGTHTVETCVVDDYDGYEYLMYASAANGATDQVDMSVQPTNDALSCSSYSFSVLPEPSPVHVSSLDVVDQGMSYITLSWNPSDFRDYPVDDDHSEYFDLEEYEESATHYDVERTTTPTDVNSWSNITTLSVVREYSASTCDGKADDYDNYSDDCENPNDAQASDDGEWFYMGRGSDGKFHFLDEGLDASTTYHYRVYASNSHGAASKTGNVVSHSTEAKPELTLSSDMSAEIYAAGEMTNTLAAQFSAADGLGGHNVSSVTSSYTTYEGTSSNDDGYAGPDGASVEGPDAVDFSYEVTAWETDHGQSIEVCFEDAGDYWGYDKEGSCTSTATFTASEEFLHHPFNYEGWHVFGSPLYFDGGPADPPNTMDNLFLAGLSDYSEGSDYVWFSQNGSFSPGTPYEHGTAYFLGLNHDLVSFTMSGGVLTTHDGNLADADHVLSRGWNLVSPKLVRPVSVDMLEVTDELGTHTWAEAQTLGIVSGEVLGTDQYSNFESNHFHPWTGFWIHVSKSCTLNVTPHAFDAARESKVSDEFTWNMNIEAQSIDGDARGDIIKIGLSDNASNDIKDGEDTEDIPVITMADSYLDIYMKESNGMTYWKNTKEMISPEEGQAWVINGYSANSNSDVQLSWTMDELDEAYEVKMYINGDVIDMREETSIVVSTESLNNITVIVGNDPLASGLATPAEFALTDAYPNPFNPVTSMQLSLNVDGYTSVKVYNLMGQIVDVIHEGMLNAGFHKVTWNAEVIPSGVYLVKVEQGDKIATQKVMLMK